MLKTITISATSKHKESKMIKTIDLSKYEKTMIYGYFCEKEQKFFPYHHPKCLVITDFYCIQTKKIYKMY